MLISCPEQTARRQGGMSAVSLKEEGNALFKAGAVPDAIAKYNAALDAAAAEATDSSVSGKLAADVHNNLAACFLKLEQPEAALLHCDRALAIEPGMLKVMYRMESWWPLWQRTFLQVLFECVTVQAKYRRAQALERMGRVDEALALFKKLVEEVPAAQADAQRTHNLVTVSALPQSDVVWLCLAGMLRGWVKHKSGAEIRPWVVCLVRYQAAKDGEEDVRGLIGLKRLSAAPTSDDVTFLCLDAMARHKTRPKQITFQEPDFIPKEFAFTGVTAAVADDDSAATLPSPTGALLSIATVRYHELLLLLWADRAAVFAMACALAP